MEIVLTCKTCHAEMKSTRLDENAPENMTLVCFSGHTNEVRFPEALRLRGEWDRCPACGATDRYVQKDVPKRLFLGILAVCMVGAFYLLSINWYLGMGVLVALALFDFILYRALPNAQVCYGCGTLLRGAAGPNTLKPFDPHVGEHYRTIRQ